MKTSSHQLTTLSKNEPNKQGHDTRVVNIKSNEDNCSKDVQFKGCGYNPNRENELSKEERRLKQEEYRKLLVNQRKEELARREKEKEKLSPPPIAPLYPEGVNDTSLGKALPQGDNKTKAEKDLVEEIRRQKQEEYYNSLQQQIRERQLKKEIEKQLQIEEDLKRGKAIAHNNPAIIQLKGKNNCRNQLLTTEEQLILQQQELLNADSYPQISQQEVTHSTLSIQKQRSTAVIPPLISQGHRMEPQHPLKKSLSPFDLSCGNTHFAPQEHLNLHNDNQFPSIQGLSNACNTPSSKSISQPATQQPLLSLGNINEIFQNFVNAQMSHITAYEVEVGEIETLNPNKSSYEVIQMLVNERNSTMEKMLEDQEHIKALFGFTPMQSDFNQKVSHLLNLILDKKVDHIHTTQKRLFSPSTEIESSQFQPLPPPSKPKEASVTVLKRVATKEDQRKDGSVLLTSQVNKDLNVCRYFSKYEDLKQSLPNSSDASDFKESLAGYSKLVAPISNNDISNSHHLYQTWRNESTDKQHIKLNPASHNLSQSKLLISDSLTKSNENNISNRAVNGNHIRPNQAMHSNLDLFDDSSLDAHKPKHSPIPQARRPVNGNSNPQQSFTSINESYGDNIINELNKYQRMALDL